MSIEVRNIQKTFHGTTPALHNVTASIREGELIGFLGPSGSGKTTLLRIIAGLETQSAGQVLIDGRVVDELPPQQRGVGFVFQSYALFKHMTVFDNIAYGLRVQKKGKQEVRARVKELLNFVHLAGFEHRYPHQLSGGQAQRVALARALAPRPKILLLDEPFAAIDTKIRKELRQWIRHVHDELGITSIFVTHDQEEALEIADRVLVMNQGKVEQLGTPEEVYESPASLFVANFVGEANHYAGTAKGGRVAFGPMQVPAPAYPDGCRLHVVIRPSDVKLRESTAEGDVVGEVAHVSYRGNFYAVEVTLRDDTRILAYASKAQDHLLNTGTRVAIEVTGCRLFEEGPVRVESSSQPERVDLRKFG
ncbi:ABC transporter ATP-binding protein [Alicyclobacillus cycloheptanicus]|uniref:Sulfate transport system ATP-binding protein n=1 Tax=Alicyclobacillus cycloheptanicus TaxID=1457 RepID=A0ABT9XH00_9BACL|nr:ABC transporter ATP-binding protein [Alicyclobacillus cycloheptanicus]MDQ0189584.1 sulfate transport system ATP-binding protein [Alicyclobacillus cycloheptanicus]WDL99895.1 ABC transporter ATP-binding protein [Alicyclobacillus cycloheptanicus]